MVFKYIIKNKIIYDIYDKDNPKNLLFKKGAQLGEEEIGIFDETDEEKVILPVIQRKVFHHNKHIYQVWISRFFVKKRLNFQETLMVKEVEEDFKIKVDLDAD